MTKQDVICIVLVFSLSLFGCAIYLPFENRISYDYIREVKKINVVNKSPLSINWIPQSFPQRVDIQGASGFVGGASRTRIPIGVALSKRITELLDMAVGIDQKSKDTLTITVIQAKTEFKYDAFALENTIKSASCVLKAEFTLNGHAWKSQFYASDSGASLQGTSQTAVLNSVWDNISFQVAKNIIEHMNEIN